MNQININKVIRANIYQTIYMFTGCKRLANLEANRRMEIDKRTIKPENKKVKL